MHTLGTIGSNRGRISKVVGAVLVAMLLCVGITAPPADAVAKTKKSVSWKSYVNKSSGIKIKYPRSWKISIKTTRSDSEIAPGAHNRTIKLRNKKGKKLVTIYYVADTSCECGSSTGPEKYKQMLIDAKDLSSSFSGRSEWRPYFVYRATRDSKTKWSTQIGVQWVSKREFKSKGKLRKARASWGPFVTETKTGTYWVTGPHKTYRSLAAARKYAKSKEYKLLRKVITKAKFGKATDGKKIISY